MRQTNVKGTAFGYWQKTCIWSFLEFSKHQNRGFSSKIQRVLSLHFARFLSGEDFSTSGGISQLGHTKGYYLYILTKIIDFASFLSFLKWGEFLYIVWNHSTETHQRVLPLHFDKNQWFVSQILKNMICEIEIDKWGGVGRLTCSCDFPSPPLPSPLLPTPPHSSPLATQFQGLWEGKGGWWTPLMMTQNGCIQFISHTFQHILNISDWAVNCPPYQTLFPNLAFCVERWSNVPVPFAQARACYK